MSKKQLKLDLACGNNLQKDFIGVDITKKGTKASIEFNLLTFPWTFAKDNSVDEVFASHFLEHIPHGDGFHDPFFQFFDEVHRILKPGGIARFVTPYYAHARAFQDPTHQRFIPEMTYHYLTVAWRKANKLTHYPVKCDFEIVKIDHGVSPEYTGKSQEAISYSAMHEWNVIMDLMVILRKPKLK